MRTTRFQYAGLACVGLGILVLLGTVDPFAAIGGMLLVLTGAALLMRTDVSLD